MREGRLRWYGHVMKKRPGVHRKKGDGNGVTGREETKDVEDF